MSDFRFHVPITFEKAGPDGSTMIGGICSTDDLDSEGERLLQEGLDFGPFLKSGYFNDNHGADTGAAVGHPTLAQLRELPGGRRGWYVAGHLYNTQRGREIIELAQTLERSESGRKLGFSVEGKVLDRDPSDPSMVRRAIVKEVAITRCPVNTNTGLQLLAKSLSVGTAVNVPRGVPVTGEGAGRVLSRQSLEGKDTPAPEDDEKKKKKKRMTKAEAFALLRQKTTRLSDAQIQTIVDYAAQLSVA